MFFLSVSEYIKNIKLNLLVAFLLSVLATAIVFVSSIIGFEWNRYSPFSRLNGKEGVFYSTDNDYSSECIDEKYYTYFSNLYLASGNDDSRSISVICLPEWMSKNYESRLDYGEWISGNSSDDYLEIVIGGERAHKNYKVGQIITCNIDNEKSVKCKIIGIVPARSSIISASNFYSSGKINYSMYFDILYDDLYIVTDYNAAKKHNLLVYTGLKKIITFKSEYEDEAKELYDTILENSEGTAVNLTVWNDNCREFFMLSIRTYMPIVVVVIVLVLICSYASVYVVQAYSARHMAIYYLVGANEKHRFDICMGNGVGIVLFSVLLDVFVFEIIYILGLDKSGIFEIKLNTIGLLITLYIIYLLLIGLMFKRSVKNKSPKDYLRENM